MILHTGVRIDVYMGVVPAIPICVFMDVDMDAYMLVALGVAMHDDLVAVIDAGEAVSAQGGVTADTNASLVVGQRAC